MDAYPGAIDAVVIDEEVLASQCASGDACGVLVCSVVAVQGRQRGVSAINDVHCARASTNAHPCAGRH